MQYNAKNESLRIHSKYVQFLSIDTYLYCRLYTAVFKLDFSIINADDRKERFSQKAQKVEKSLTTVNHAFDIRTYCVETECRMFYRRTNSIFH